MVVGLKLDIPQGKRYAAGSLVTGGLIVVIKDSVPDTLTTLSVRIHGGESVRWTETERYTTGYGDKRKTHTKTVVYSDSHVVFDKTVDVWSSEEDEPLKEGVQVIQFAIRIPKNAPPTVSRNYGNIKYVIKATADGKYTTSDEDLVIAMSKQNVKYHTDDMLSSGFAVHNVGCLCCAAGNVSSAISVPEGLGQYLSFGKSSVSAKFLAENNTTRRCKVFFTIEETVTYRAKNRTKTTTNCAYAFHLPVLNPMTQKEGSWLFSCSEGGARVTPRQSAYGKLLEITHRIRIGMKASWAMISYASVDVLLGALDFEEGEGDDDENDGDPPKPSTNKRADYVKANYTQDSTAVDPTADVVFNELIDLLRQAGGDKKEKMSTWLLQHPNINPSPKQTAEAMSQVFSLLQPEIAGMLAQGVPKFTCEHANAVLDVVLSKRDVLKAMSPYISDKAQHAQDIIEHASMLDQDDFRAIVC